MEGNRVEVVKDNFLMLFVNFLLLAKNNVAFTLNSTALKLGVLQNVADDVDGRSDVLSERLCVVHSLFARRVRIQVSTEVLNLELKRLL